MMIKVAEAVETIDGPPSPELGRGWTLLTQRLVGCGKNGHHVWSHFVSARAVTISGGLVVRTVPLPYPVRLLREEVEAQTLTSSSSASEPKMMMMRCYTGSMSLTLSDARWSPCLVLDTGKVCYGLRHPSPERGRKGGDTAASSCRAVLTLEGLHELPHTAVDHKEEGGGGGLWNRFLAEWNATFFPPP